MNGGRFKMPDFADFVRQYAGRNARKMETQAASGRQTLLLLTCIDLRYPALIHRIMEPHFHKLYDHVALAGAGLAGVVDFSPHRKPHWQQTILEHVAISKSLHDISSVWVLEHRDCGAYRTFGVLGPTPDDGAPEDVRRRFEAEETEAHRKHARRFAELIRKEFDGLEVFLFLLPKESGHDKADEADGGTPSLEYDEIVTG